jgi:hypothetical protein
MRVRPAPGRRGAASPRRGSAVTAAVLGLALGAVALLAGCGGSSSSNALNATAGKSPDEIVADAKAAAAKAATVHITGSTVNENRPISIDMELVAGKGAKGRLELGGLGIQIVALERAFYLNGSAEFYRRLAGSAAAALLHGKWLKAPAGSGNFASLAQLTNLNSLLESSLAGHGTLVKGQLTTVEGHKAVSVRDAGRSGTLYVAATGAPYPLKLTHEGGNVFFRNWNKPVTLTAPANAINITQLQNGH